MLKVLFSWYDWSALCLGVVGLKPKWSQRPIMTKNNILRRQWELLVETCELPEARENLNDQGAIGFSFPSDWLWEGCGYLDQSHRKVMQKWLSIPGHFRYSIGHFTVFSIFYIYVHLFFFLSYQHVMYLRELRLAQMERLMAEFLYGVDIYLSIARDSKELNPKVTRKYAIFF